MEPHPKGQEYQRAGLHWLRIGPDGDGRLGGLIALQWQPGAKKWCHSGDIDTGRNVSTEGWLYVSHIPQPDIFG